MRTMFMGSGSNLLLRKSVVDLVNGYDESFKRNQDIEFLVRVLEHKKIAYVDEVLLTIYQEGNRVVRSFEELDGYAKYYIDRFSERIEALDKKDKLKVMSVISLERDRAAIAKKEASKAVDILVENKVLFSYICKYVIYIIYRCITHKSVGFDGSLSFPK